MNQRQTIVRTLLGRTGDNRNIKDAEKEGRGSDEKGYELRANCGSPQEAPKTTY